MTERFDHGPLRPYEVTWRSGHIETIWAHQVLWPHEDNVFLGVPSRLTPRVLIHGEVEGNWQLLLAADEADILSVRVAAVTEVETRD